jgi:hypothetical protein
VRPKMFTANICVIAISVAASKGKIAPACRNLLRVDLREGRVPECSGIVANTDSRFGRKEELPSR